MQSSERGRDTLAMPGTRGVIELGELESQHAEANVNETGSGPTKSSVEMDDTDAITRLQSLFISVIDVAAAAPSKSEVQP